MALLALAVASLQAIARSGPLYTAQPLSLDRFTGKDINESGEVVGNYFSTSVLEGRYFDGRAFTLGLGGDHYSWSSLYGVNNNHFAVGQHTVSPYVDPSFAVRAVMVYADPAAIPPRNLGSLVGPDGDSNATAINDSNLAVGESETRSGAIHAVRFELNGAVTDLGTLGGTNSSAADINNHGDIIGKSQNAQGNWRAFLLPAGGSLIELGTLGGSESEAVRINNRGEIIGSALTAGGARHAFVYSNGMMTDLGTLFGETSEALGINDRGVVVGTSGEAFIKFPDGPLTALSKLVAVRYNEILSAATAINNHGVIVATFYDGANNTRLLRPGHLTTERREDHSELKFSAPAGTRVVFEQSSSLVAWSAFLTNILSDTNLTYSYDARSDSNLFFRALVTAPPLDNNRSVTAFHDLAEVLGPNK